MLKYNFSWLPLLSSLFRFFLLVLVPFLGWPNDIKWPCIVQLSPICSGVWIVKPFLGCPAWWSMVQNTNAVHAIAPTVLWGTTTRGGTKWAGSNVGRQLWLIDQKTNVEKPGNWQQNTRRFGFLGTVWNWMYTDLNFKLTNSYFVVLR